MAVDIIGHPGKSAENSLPASGYDYGRWAGEVIDQLGFDRISLFGGAFGGVIERAEKIIPNCTTYLLRGRGHMHYRSSSDLSAATSV